MGESFWCQYSVKWVIWDFGNISRLSHFFERSVGRSGMFEKRKKRYSIRSLVGSVTIC